MKLRIAKKICKAVGTPRQDAYNDFQVGKAHIRCQRTKSAKEAERYWNWLMEDIGVLGRAKVLTGIGAVGSAFELLMKEDW